MDSKTITDRVISGFAWVGSTRLAIQVVTWIATIYVARILSPEDYGIVAISGVFTGILLVVTDMGFMASLINQDDINKEDLDSVFWLNLLLSIALFALLYFLAPLIGYLYGSEVLVDIIRLAALILPIKSMKIVPLSIAMRKMDFKYRALTEMLGQLVTSASSVVLVTIGFGVWSLVWGVLIGQFVALLAYLPLLGGMPALRINFGRIRHILPYGLYMMGSEMLAFFTRRSDVMIIGLFLPGHQVGLYSMGFQLATIPLDKVGALFNRVAFPVVSRIKGQISTTRNLFCDMHMYLLIIAYPALIGVALTAEQLVPVLFTAKWMPLVPVLQALCILNLLRISGMLMPYMLAGMGRSRQVFRYNLLSSILLPVAFVIGAQYGLEGVLMAWFVAYPVLYIILASKIVGVLELPLSRFLGTLRISVSCVSIMAAVLYITNLYIHFSTPQQAVPVLIAIGAGTYLLSCYVLFRKEVKRLLNRVRKLRSS